MKVFKKLAERFEHKFDYGIHFRCNSCKATFCQWNGDQNGLCLACGFTGSGPMIEVDDPRVPLFLPQIFRTQKLTRRETVAFEKVIARDIGRRQFLFFGRWIQLRHELLNPVSDAEAVEALLKNVPPG